MKRRGFLGLTGAAAVRLGIASLGRAQSVSGPPRDATAPGELRLAGMSLAELRQGLYDQLFRVLLPFWDKHGIDHEYGGLMCSLDYDGTLLGTGKNLWFLGRAIWVYSFLYNHFGNNPQFLEVAKRTKEFVFKYARQKDGWWAEGLSREGKVLRPFSGDTEGMYHLAEGLDEYAAASGDDQSREAAFAILNKLFQDFDSPAFRYRGADFPYLWSNKRAIRPQGLWFLNLRIATQMLARGNNPQIAAIADRALDAIMNRHYNPDIGLNTEMLYYDFTRPKEEAQKSRFGHSVEALWMVMDEANRRHDEALWKTCAPVQAKARPMPPDHRVRFHNDQNIRPSRPYVPQRGPEEAVEAVQRRSRPFSFEHGDLLSQCENFQGGVDAIAEEGADSSQECGDQVEHESTVVTSHKHLHGTSADQDRKLLI